MKWGWLLTAVALAAFLWVRRRRLGRVELGAGVLATAGAVLVGTGVVDLPEHREADRGRRDEARPLDLPARRRAGLPRDGRLRRARRAGRDRGARRRPRGRPGPDRPARPDRDRLDVRGGRRPDLLHDRAPARPRLAAAPRRPAEDHRGAAAPGRGVLREARRGHDPDRALHRARARARAVHRRHLEDAAAQFLPYDIIGAGAWATTFCVLGYVFWQSFDRLTQYVSRGLFAFGTVVAIGVRAVLPRAAAARPRAAREASRRGWSSARTGSWARPLLKLAGPRVAAARAPGRRRRSTPPRASGCTG